MWLVCSYAGWMKLSIMWFTFTQLMAAKGWSCPISVVHPTEQWQEHYFHHPCPQRAHCQPQSRQSQLSADYECIIKISSPGVVHRDKPSQTSSVQICSLYSTCLATGWMKDNWYSFLLLFRIWFYMCIVAFLNLMVGYGDF